MQIHLPDLSTHPMLALLLVGANWPLYRWFLRVLFGDLEGLGEAIRFWFTPDLWSYIRNRYLEDKWAELRLFVWISMSIGCVLIEYALIDAFLAWWYTNVICCAPGATG